MDHGSLVVGTGISHGFSTGPMGPGAGQELGHGPFDGPFSFFPGMAMSIAGTWCGVCGFFFVREDVVPPVLEK